MIYVLTESRHQVGFLIGYIIPSLSAVKTVLEFSLLRFKNLDDDMTQGTVTIVIAYIANIAGTYNL